MFESFAFFITSKFLLLTPSKGLQIDQYDSMNKFIENTKMNNNNKMKNNQTTAILISTQV